MSNRINQGTGFLRAAGLLGLVLAIFGVTSPWSFGTEKSLLSGSGLRVHRRAVAERAEGSEGSSGGRQEEDQNPRLAITVIDENGVPVPSAMVTLVLNPTQAASRGETDPGGRCQFKQLVPGVYHVRAEKEGFYAADLKDFQVAQAQSVEITLNHQQEFVQRVDVTSSPPAIDPTKTNASESLNSHEISHLPYTGMRDIRQALPLMPGVLQDATGHIHVDGSAAREAIGQLDGFNMNAPVSGLFTMHVNVDSLRSVDVQSGRYSAEYGKGSGGVLSLITGMGSDHFHFSYGDFLPSLQTHKGIHLNSWTPRATLSGPVRKGKAWFLLAPDGEYHMHVLDDLPPGGDRSSSWRASNLAKAQVNLTSGNILTGSFLVNRLQSRHGGLSRFTPLETTLNANQAAYLFAIKDQVFLSSGVLLEAGLAASQFDSSARPLGDATYVIGPGGTRGNFFQSSTERSSRLQGIANLTFPVVQWRGSHQFKVGADINRIRFDQFYQRRPFLILRENGKLSQKVSFGGYPSFAGSASEVSGFAQDRWALTDRLLVESGMRLDWDEIIHSTRVSPRLAASYMLTRDGRTKIVGGVGLYYDATDLGFLIRPRIGHRMDSFYDVTGLTLAGAPVETSFQVNEGALKEPRFLNWSAGLERKLPGSVYSQLEFLQKRGHHEMTFVNQCSGSAGCFSGHFELQNVRRDRYDSAKLTLRRTFRGDHIVFVSYTRSSARSNAVVDFSLENPLFTQQAGGPLPWDSPNRFMSWGFLPLRHGFSLAYWVDWREGFPFSIVNQRQQLVGNPDSRRFPTYFSVNVALERRFQLLGYQWGLRAGLDDVTNRHNATAVNNNVDSSSFLAYGSTQRRGFVGHIKFLGRT